MHKEELLHRIAEALERIANVMEAFYEGGDVEIKSGGTGKPPPPPPPPGP